MGIENDFVLGLYPKHLLQKDDQDDEPDHDSDCQSDHFDDEEELMDEESKATAAFPGMSAAARRAL